LAASPGLWVFLLVHYWLSRHVLFQRLFINTLAESPECKDYPSVISGYLGKNWGILLGALYFVMLVIWMFVYSTAITNDSASYLHLRRDRRFARKIRSTVYS
jgi:amino acid permease